MPDTLKPWEQFKDVKPWDLEWDSTDEESPEIAPSNTRIRDNLTVQPTPTIFEGDIQGPPMPPDLAAQWWKAHNPILRPPDRSPISDMPGSIVGLRPVYRGIEGPLIQTPDFKGTDLASGISQSVKQGVESMTSPLAIATAPLLSEEIAGATLARIAKPIITGTFAGLGAKGAGEAAGTLAGTPNPTGAEYGKAIGDIAQSGLMMLAPTVEPIAEGLRKTSATEVALPKETSASVNRKATEIHGDLLRESEQGAGQVPAKESGEGVRSETEGGIPKEEVTPSEQIAQDLGIAARKPIRDLWQFDVVDPKDGQPTGFSIKEGSTPEQVKAKADELRGKLVEDIGQKLTPDIVERLSTVELQKVMGGRGHRVGIEYGETLSEKDVPELQKKYDDSQVAMKEALKNRDIDAAQKEGAKQIFYGGALMGATEGKHPISGSNYELYKQQKAAEAAKAERPTGRGLQLKQPEPATAGEAGFINLGQVINDVQRKLKNTREGFKTVFRSQSTRHTMDQTLDAADNQANVIGQQMGKRVKIGTKPIEDIAASVLVAADFDRNKLNDFLAKSIAGGNKEAENAVRYAMANWNQVEPIARRGKDIFDQQLAQENAKGIETEYHQGYLPGVYDMDLLIGAGRPYVIAGSRGGGVASGFKKGKTYPTPFDAIADGYKPRSLNLSDLVEHRVRSGQRLINRIDWGDALRGVTDPTDNRPIVTSMTKKQRPSGTGYEVAPMGYVPREIIPGIRVAIHEGYSKLFDALTGRSHVEDFEVKGVPVGSLALQTAGGIKHGLVLFDTFHAGRIMRKQLFLTGKIGYEKGRTLLEYSDADLNRAVQAGDITQEMADYARTNRPTAQLLAKNGLNIGRVQEALYTSIARKIPGIGGFNRWVFDKLTRGAMMESSLIEFDRVKKNNPGWSDGKVAQTVSRDLNKYFGNLGRSSVFKSKTMQDLSRLAFLAPQWTEGVVRSELGGAKQLAIDPFIKRKLAVGSLGAGMAKGLGAYLVATQIVNLITRGKPTWQNEEKDHKLDAWIPDVSGKSGGYFISPFSVMAETTHDLIKAMRSEPDTLSAVGRVISNKAAPLWRAGKVLLSGKDWSGKDVVGSWNKAKEAAIEALPTPIPVSQAIKGKEGSTERAVLQAIGEKTEAAPTPRSEVFERAKEWGLNNKDPKIQEHYKALQTSKFPESAYKPIRDAIRAGDNPAIVKAFRDILEKEPDKEARDKKATQIIKQFEPFVVTDRLDTPDHPKHFATDSWTHEKLFLKSQDEAGKKAWRDALHQRVEDYRKLTEAIYGTARNPPIPEAYRAEYGK